MHDLHAVLTRREGTVVSLSILTSAGAEVERRRTRELLEPGSETVWADRVLDELQLHRLADWRTTSPFADEAVYEVKIGHQAAE